MTAPNEAAVLAERKSESLPYRLASVIDRNASFLLPVWILAYFFVLWHPAHRPLWFDELFTYNVAMSPTFEIFWSRVRNVDLNPPLIYLFIRSTVALFGDTPFVTRITPMLAYLGAGLIVYRFIAGRVGGALGLAALGIFWSFSLTSFAVETRTYALLLAFLTIAMYCWLHAAENPRWTKWHAGLGAAVVGMLLTHCFSPAFVAAVGLGELVRTLVSRRIDKRVWTVILVPLVLVLFYIPLVKNARAYQMPPAFTAKLSTAPMFYFEMLFPVLPVFGVMLLLWAVTNRWKPAIAWGTLAKPHEIGFAAAAFSLPAIIIVNCYISGLGFFARYGVGAALGGCLIITALLARITKQRVEASATAAVAILLLFCLTGARTSVLSEAYDDPSLAYQTIDSSLPFVTSCGLTFLEMDHRESQAFTKRLFYLLDVQAALKYTQSNVMEGYPILQRYFPIRANLAQYQEFVKHNRRFLVLASPDCPLEWLLRKLKDDGANIRLLQEAKFGYRDRNLYEVNFASEDIAANKSEAAAR